MVRTVRHQFQTRHIYDGRWLGRWWTLFSYR